jgi:hypothetical protein
MTEQVRVSGHGVPPVPAGATVTEHSRESGIPPRGMEPGFVPPQATPPQQQYQQPAPVVQSAPAIDPTVAALLAALSGQNAPAPTGTPAPSAAPVQGGSTGDPVADSLTGILASSGLTVSKAVANALEYGDANLIDRDYIKSVGGANADHLIKMAEALVDHTNRAGDAAVAAAHGFAGGESNWNAAASLFKQRAPAHLQAICTQMLDSGNRTQSDAAAQMVVEFAKGNGGMVQQAGLITGGAMPGMEAALSKEQFQAELQKLDRNDRQYEARRGELFGRRAMGRKLGR